MLEKKYIIALVIVGIIILGTASYFIIKAITKNPSPSPPSPNPPPTPSQCSSSNCASCTNKDSCTKAGCTFDGTKCSSSSPPPPPPPPPPCSSTNCDGCKTEETCNAQAGCTFDETCFPKCSTFKTEQDCNNQDRCIYNKNVCQDKVSCVFPCTPNGKCNGLTGICDCNDRYAGDSCQFFYPTSLPSQPENQVCFMPGKLSNGKFKTLHNNSTGSMYTTFVITCPVFDYVEAKYTKIFNGCNEGAEWYRCYTYCNTLSSSSLNWKAGTGSCCEGCGTCQIPSSDNSVSYYSTISNMDKADPLQTPQTSVSGIRVLFPPSDPDNPTNTTPPPDVQWLLNDYVQIKDEKGKPYDYYQILSNTTVNQSCGLDKKYKSQPDTFYYNDQSYGDMIGTGNQLNNVCIGISATNLKNVKTDSIEDSLIRNAQLIPLITDDFMKPQLLPGNFEEGTTWINLGVCKTNTIVTKGMTMYVRLKPTGSDSYIRLYLYSQSSQVGYGPWLGECRCAYDGNPGQCGTCRYNPSQVVPVLYNKKDQNRRTPLLYWVVWSDKDIELADDFNTEESDTLGQQNVNYLKSHGVKMPNLGDFFKWSIYGVAIFAQKLSNNVEPLGSNTPDGGGAPSCMLPACPPDISKLYFMDKDGAGKDKSACHLLEAEPDKFNNCLMDRSTCGIQGVWGYDQSVSDPCQELGCGNLLTSKCDNGLSDTTDTTHMCDLTRQPPTYYSIDSITPSKENKWGGSGYLNVSANVCNDPSTKIKDLYTNTINGCVSNDGPNISDPNNLFADPNCVYNCGKLGMKPKQPCKPNQYYCQEGSGCKQAADKGGTFADKCYNDKDCSNECSGPTPPSPGPGPPSTDICKTKCSSGSYCKGNPGTCQGCDNIKCP